MQGFRQIFIWIAEENFDSKEEQQVKEKGQGSKERA